jgi:hypothetical protein
MSETTSLSAGPAKFHGNDNLPGGIIFGVASFRLFAKITLNIAAWAKNLASMRA